MSEHANEENTPENQVQQEIGQKEDGAIGANTRRVGLYVIPGGPDKGTVVGVVELINGKTQINEETGEMRSDLALVDSPDVHFETLSLYSEGKEPGTWHWA